MYDKKVVYLKAMQALNSRLVATCDNEEALAVLNAIKDLQDFEYVSEKVLEQAFEHCTDAVIKYVIVNRNVAIGDTQISLLIETPNNPLPEDLSTGDGVFAFVYNVDLSLDSELGYIFLEKANSGSYRRIG